MIPFAFASAGTLTSTCVDGTLGSGNCTPGRVTFNSSAYSTIVHVNVTKSTGEVYDDFDYDASSGVLNFTETLLRGWYTITITANGSATTQTVTVGSWGDDND